MKHVVEFKWRTYTREFFLKQLALALMFLLWFIIDIINGQTADYQPYSARTISFRVLSIVFLLDQMIHESKQLL